MTTYTTVHTLPLIEGSDKIADTSSTATLRQDINRLSTATDSAISAEGERVKTAVNPYVKQLLATDDLNTALGRGPATTSTYYVGQLGSPNMPPNPWTGFLEVITSANGKSYLQRLTYSNGSGVWQRDLLDGSGGWSYGEWKRVDSPAGTQAASQRDVLASAFRRRRGSVIGTSGKAVVSLRFDHGLTKFESSIVPLLQARDLPAANTVNSRDWADPTNAGMNQAEARALWLNSGIEFTNHGAYHQASDTEPAIYDNIVNGLTELQAQFPQSPIEMWMPASNGGTGFLGFNGGDTVEKFHSTYAGRLVTQNHAAVSGYLPGIYRPLPATLDIGLVHYTMDSQAPADIEAAIRGVITAGASLTLMFHPVYLDTPGYLTTAGLTQVLDYLVTKRDAGEVEVLSCSGALIADPTTDARHNLATNGRFGNGLTGWGNTTGWTVATTNGLTWATTATGTALTQTVPMSRQAQYRGSNREVVAKVKAGTSATTVRLGIYNGGALNTSKDYAIPANGVLEIRKPFSIPLTDGGDLTLTVGRVSGGAVSISDVRVQSI